MALQCTVRILLKTIRVFEKEKFPFALMGQRRNFSQVSPILAGNFRTISQIYEPKDSLDHYKRKTPALREEVAGVTRADIGKGGLCLILLMHNVPAYFQR